MDMTPFSFIGTLFDSADKNSGRNSRGKMINTFWWWSQAQNRIIDFQRTKEGIPATVKSR
jgi:ribosomal protein L2